MEESWRAFVCGAATSNMADTPASRNVFCVRSISRYYSILDSISRCLRLNKELLQYCRTLIIVPLKCYVTITTFTAISIIAFSTRGRSPWSVQCPTFQDKAKKLQSGFPEYFFSSQICRHIEQIHSRNHALIELLSFPLHTRHLHLPRRVQRHECVRACAYKSVCVWTRCQNEHNRKTCGWQLFFFLSARSWALAHTPRNTVFL